MSNWCKHFSGIIGNKTCDAGVDYDSIRPPEGRRHCTDENATVRCALYTPHTPEEIAEQNRKLNEVINRMADFWDGEGDECPVCGEKVESAEQIGRCVYARPCGCRAGQGELPERWGGVRAWKKEL